MKVLVTGANGYLGQGIVKEILSLGHQVVASDINLDYVDERAIKVLGSAFDVENPYEYYGKPDAVLHLAWRDGFVHNSEKHLSDFYSHYSFLKKMIDSGVKNINVMGSMHEVGFYEGAIDENTPCNPMSLYGISKNALREAVLVLKSSNDFCLKWLRGYYIVGNSAFGASIFSKITAAEKEGNAEFPFTTGQNKYDFLDYDEFCKQVAKATTQTEVDGIINICSGEPTKLCDRVERFIKENNYNIKLKYGVFPDRQYDSKIVYGDNTKIKKIMEKK